MIRRVVEKILALRRERRPRALRVAVDVAEFLIKSNVYVAAGAAALTYANAVLLGVEHKAVSALVAALYMFSMHVVNQFADKEAQKLNDPARAAFYDRHAWSLVGLAAGLAIVSVAIAFCAVSRAAFLVLVIASVLGAIYRLELLPRGAAKSLRYRRLADIPCSRELFLAGAWCVTAVVIPLLAQREPLSPAFGVALAFTFALAFTRAALLDIRDIQGDRIVGKETMPIVFGKMAVKTALGLLLFVVAALLLLAPGLGWCPALAYGLLACLLYACAYLWFYHWRLIGEGYLCEGVVDANFLLAGIVAYLWAAGAR
jgi:4-hydroxy-3-methylbut-2-enyl diphosphate reductase